MPSKKRFRIGNMTVNLGKIDDALKYQPDPNCQHTYGCNQFTWGGGGGCPSFTYIGCGLTNNPCGKNYSTLPPTTLVQDPIDQSIDLQIVKESLVTQLKEIEAYEIELKVQETPQTIEEINMLEQEIEDSLKEIKKLKTEFKK